MSSYTAAEASRLIVEGRAPVGMDVSGSLDFRMTAVTALPDDLTVGGDLYLRGTAVTALPNGLTVGGDLVLSRTKGALRSTARSP